MDYITINAPLIKATSQRLKFEKINILTTNGGNPKVSEVSFIIENENGVKVDSLKVRFQGIKHDAVVLALFTGDFVNLVSLIREEAQIPAEYLQVPNDLDVVNMLSNTPVTQEALVK